MSASTVDSTVKSEQPSSNIRPLVVHRGVAYLSGQLPREDGRLVHRGKVGDDIDLPTAQAAARLCAQLSLDTLQRELGPAHKLARLLKITGYVSSTPEFTEQGKVLDAASDVFLNELGDRGTHARSAIGVAQLPHGACVEIELIVSVETA